MTPTTTLPVSKGHWLLKNLGNMAKDMRKHLFEQEKTLGNTFEYAVPFRRVIATSDPGLMRHVLQSNHRNYEKGQAYEILKLGLGNGLVTSNGKFWQRQRRLAQPAFHKKNMEDLFASMGEVAQAYFTNLEKKRGTDIDLTKEMMDVTARIALKALFTDNTNEDLNRIYDCMTDIQRFIVDAIHNPLWPLHYRLNGRKKQFDNDKSVVDKVVLTSIAKRRKSTQKYPDLLQMMMDATYEDSNEQMDDDLLRDEMVTMFSAGHETSANGLTWILYTLSKHPEIVAKMRAEIETVVGDKLPSFQELRQLTYIRQVIDEGMRLFPPVWGISRSAINEDEFNGIKINKGDKIFCMIYNAHHSAKLYENPETFNPDRFAPEKIKAMPKMSYLPFGGGPRLCIGNMFAIMEMQLLLVGLVQRFDFQLTDNQVIDMEGLITLRPRFGMKMRLV